MLHIPVLFVPLDFLTIAENLHDTAQFGEHNYEHFSSARLTLSLSAIE